MNNGDADKALRDLFRSDGAFHAPGDLDARILERIAPAPVKEKALVPRWTWFLLAAALSVPLFLPDQSGFKLPNIGAWIPDPDIAGSSWLIPSLTCAVLLLGLEAWLIHRRSTAVTS